jgi:ribosomal-protein-alanine N-acetyltransferase
MQKCGMTYEGTAIQASRNNTGLCDAAMYGMINPGNK